MEWCLGQSNGRLTEATILCMGIFEAMSALIRTLEDHEFSIEPYMLASSPVSALCLLFDPSDP